MATEGWRSSETLAWTERDGVTPPPKGVNRWFLGSVACSMAAVWVGMMTTDALCPDHRLWVQTLGMTALVSAVAAIVGLVGQRSWAPLAALASALLGIAVGFIDAIHDPTRGAFISLAFAVVAVVVLLAAVPLLRSALWLRRAKAELATEQIELPATPVAAPAQADTIEGTAQTTVRRTRIHG